MVREPARHGAAALLERDGELERIDELIGASVGGDGRFLLIEGRSGIGKTALLGELKVRAQVAGMRVCSARCTELEGEFAFGVVRQLFEPAARELGRDLFEGAAALAAPVLGLSGERAARDQFAVLRGLYWLAADLAAGAPLLLAVDDAHWADTPSLRWLAYLLNRLEGLPILVALAARPVRPGKGTGALAGLLGEQSVEVLRLGPLGKESVGTLVAEALDSEPDPLFTAACLRATAGNPLALRGVMRDLAAEGVQPTAAAAEVLEQRVPVAVARRVLAHLARLGEEALRFARALAVLGDGSEVRRVASLAGLEPEAASEAADDLLSVDLLGPDRPPSFAHPLQRAAVYEEIPPGVRSRLHGRAAELLAAEHADPEAVAAHLLRCDPGLAAEAVACLRAAAPLAVRRGSPGAAASYLTRVLAERLDDRTRAAVLGEVGHARLISADPRAVADLAQAAALSPDPVARAGIRVDLWRALLNAGDAGPGRELLRLAQDDLADGAPDVSARLEVLSAGLTAIDARPVRGFLPRLRAIAEGSGAAARPACVTLAWVLGLLREPRDEVLRLLDGGLAGESFIALETADSFWALWAGAALFQTDELGRALSWARDLAAEAVARGSVRGLLNATALLVWTELNAGLLAEAEADGRAALDIARRHSGFWVTVVSGLLASTLHERGQDEAAHRVLLETQVPEGLVGTAAEVILREAKGRLLCATRRTESGIIDLRACAETCESAGLRWPCISSFGWRPALALALAGRSPDEARGLAATELDAARRADVPRAIGIALRTAAAPEPDARALDLLTEAVAVLERSSSVLELARAQLDLGTVLRRLGHRVEARGPLREALEIATRCGAAPLAQRAHTEALMAGARPRRPRLSGLHALTPGELRVARLAAEGLTNREIAQALFITAKTVADHLGAAYGKLGINSRAELSGALR
jgi:DNA-binding CsgD family transcriptional regulator